MQDLYADLLRKTSLSGCLQQDPVGPLVQDLCTSTRISCARSQALCRTTCRRPPSRLRKRNFTSTARDGHAPSPQRVIHWKSEIATLPAFRVMEHTISAEGCTSKSEIATVTSISRDGHARSPQRVALRNQKSQLYLHSAPSTRTISANGCTSKSKNATLPAFRALDTRDLRRGFTRRNHASEASPSSSSKNATPLRN